VVVSDLSPSRQFSFGRCTHGIKGMLNVMRITRSKKEEERERRGGA